MPCSASYLAVLIFLGQYVSVFMRIFRIYCSILLGGGFTALIVATLDVTWILGLMLLMPGFALVELPIISRFQYVSLLGNALFYSALAAIPVWLITNKMTASRTALARSAGIITMVVAGIVMGGWIGAKTLDQRGYGLCQNEVSNEIVSPDGRSKAVVFERGCGATSETAVNISVLPRQRTINHADMGNAFQADAFPDSIEWASNDSVVITYPATASVFARQERVGNVNVSYIAK
jgi:hypothetical protein